jgi:hypothetical protein
MAMRLTLQRVEEGVNKYGLQMLVMQMLWRMYWNDKIIGERSMIDRDTQGSIVHY